MDPPQHSPIREPVRRRPPRSHLHRPHRPDLHPPRFLRRRQHLARPLQPQRPRSLDLPHLLPTCRPRTDRGRRVRRHPCNRTRFPPGDTGGSLGVPRRSRRAGLHLWRHRLQPLRHGLLRRRRRPLSPPPRRPGIQLPSLPDSDESLPPARGVQSVDGPPDLGLGWQRDDAALRPLQPRLLRRRRSR